MTTKGLRWAQNLSLIATMGSNFRTKVTQCSMRKFKTEQKEASHAHHALSRTLTRTHTHTRTHTNTEPLVITIVGGTTMKEKPTLNGNFDLRCLLCTREEIATLLVRSSFSTTAAYFYNCAQNFEFLLCQRKLSRTCSSTHAHSLAHSRTLSHTLSLRKWFVLVDKFFGSLPSSFLHLMTMLASLFLFSCQRFLRL